MWKDARKSNKWKNKSLNRIIPLHWSSLNPTNKSKLFQTIPSSGQDIGRLSAIWIRSGIATTRGWWRTLMTLLPIFSKCWRKNKTVTIQIHSEEKRISESFTSKYLRKEIPFSTNCINIAQSNGKNTLWPRKINTLVQVSIKYRSLWKRRKKIRTCIRRNGKNTFKEFGRENFKNLMLSFTT